MTKRCLLMAVLATLSLASVMPLAFGAEANDYVVWTEKGVAIITSIIMTIATVVVTCIAWQNREIAERIKEAKPPMVQKVEILRGEEEQQLVVRLAKPDGETKGILRIDIALWDNGELAFVRVPMRHVKTNMPAFADALTPFDENRLQKVQEELKTSLQNEIDSLLQRGFMIPWQEKAN